MDVKDIFQNSTSYMEVLQKLNWNITGTNYSKLKSFVEHQEIDITHFRYPKNNNRNKIILDDDIFVQNSIYMRKLVKERLIKHKLIKYSCVFCGNDGNWMGKKISLILDHINGINNDNRLENLRFVCPNCGATLDTFCGKNVKNSKYKKENVCACGNVISTKTKLCVKCASINMRKVTRPNLKILLNDIKELGYSGTGRKYGVSDNAIRKWIKHYEGLTGLEPAQDRILEIPALTN